MRIYPLNEKAITIELGQEISKKVHSQVISLRDEILQNTFDGLLDIVIAYTTVTIYFDPHVLRNFLSPDVTPFKSMERFLSEKFERIKDKHEGTTSNTIVIPVCYDREFGLDLDWVASHHKTSVEEIVRRHTREVFTVFMIGFTPGFPYMGILPTNLESPRKHDPRTHVPAGSVGIAGKQTGIYPFTTPGGWQIIGRTPLKLFDATSSTPSLLKPGDQVRFESISKDQFRLA